MRISVTNGHQKHKAFYVAIVHPLREARAGFFRCGQIEIRIEITECDIGHLAKDQNINHVSHVTLRTWSPIRQLAGKGCRCDLFTTFFGD